MKLAVRCISEGLTDRPMDGKTFERTDRRTCLFMAIEKHLLKRVTRLPSGSYQISYCVQPTITSPAFARARLSSFYQDALSESLLCLATVLLQTVDCRAKKYRLKLWHTYMSIKSACADGVLIFSLGSTHQRLLFFSHCR